MIIEELRPKLNRIPGIRVSADQPAGDPHRRRSGRRPRRRRRLPDRAAGSGHRGALPGRAAVRGGAARDPGAAGRQLGPAAAHPAVERRSRPRADRRPRPHRRSGAVGALVRLQLPAGLADLRARRRVPGDHAGRAGSSSRIRRRSRCSTCRGPAASWSRCRGRHDAANGRAAVDQPHRPAAVGHAVVQPAARRRARRRARPRCRRWRAQRCPRPCRRPRRAPRRRSRSRCRARLDSRAGDLRHLRGPRDPLRELHPPADDSLGPAVGRLRRAAHAAALQSGPRHLRLRRHHHAGRPREEERHHDDRLRRSSARTEARDHRRPTRSTKRVSCASGRS